jgi:uncharacterized protein YecT (DUF1311 family)
MIKRLARIVLIAWALPQLPAQSMREINAQACTYSDGLEKTMGQVYSQILKAHAADKDFVIAFTAAQEAWRAFRTANIKAVYPSSNPAEYGSLHTFCLCNLSGEMAKARTAELRRRWIIGVEEGDVCVGSGVIRPPVKQNPPKKRQ